MEQTPKNPLTLETEDQGKNPQRQTKKRPVDVIRILNFRTGPKEKKKARFKSNFETESPEVNMQVVHKMFW